MNNFISKLDYNVSKFFDNIYLWGGNFSNGVMKFVSLLAEAGILFLLIGVGLALFKRTRKIGGTIILAVAIGFVITNIILKNSIGRSRPFEDITSDFYTWWVDAGAIAETGYSFPSGHTTATMAFAMAILFSTNKKYSWYIVFLPIIMACSRIYLMVHYFTDCIGGLVVGLISAFVAYMIVKLIYSSKLKFFVWLRNFDIFNPKNKSVTVENSSLIKQSIERNNEIVKQDVANNVENFVYSTQEEENSKQENVNDKSETTNYDITSKTDKSDDI